MHLPSNSFAVTKALQRDLITLHPNQHILRIMAAWTDRRILGLLMPMLVVGKDEYGKELVPPLPLSFDRVNGNRPPASDTALFKLPIEILGLILQHIPSSSLPSLALVNSDCRQLARSAQFASVKFDYSRESQLLLRSLSDEYLRRDPNERPGIASCIRRITVATDPRYIQHYLQVSLDDDFANLDTETQDSRLKSASQAVFEVYFPLLQNLICDPAILPHLELLDWEDKIDLSKSFFNALSRSNIQHLKVFRVGIAEEFKLELSSPLIKYEWPLRSLHLEISPSIGASDICNISPLCHSMLRLSACTLESLTWISQPWTVLDTFAVDNIDPPRFPRLCYLELSRLVFKDYATLGALVHDGIRVLNVCGDTELTKKFFSTRGRIPSLKVFVWDGPESPPTEFLQSNVQLSKLSMGYRLPNDVIEELLPILSSSFYTLTSLYICWHSDSIPDSALKTIATLKTLRQLHLTAGEQLGWRHSWLINHNKMLKILSPLSSLEKLAFSRDTYQHKRYNSQPTETYYFDMVIDLEQRGDETAPAWEEMHRNRMLREADKYVWEMPKLTWLYFGQLPMEVKSRSDGSRWPVPLSEERDDCWTLLKQMFGWKEGVKMWESAMV
jgi:hypothetical protein